MTSTMIRISYSHTVSSIRGLSNGEMLNESGLTAMGYDSEFAKMLEGEDFLDNQEQNKKV